MLVSTSLIDAACRQLSITSDEDDDLIASLVSAAVEFVENETGLLLSPRTITEVLGSGRDWRLRSWPITSIDQVTYRDWSAVERTLLSADFRLDTSRRPAELSIVAPAPYRTVLGALTVTLTAGYPSFEEAPATVQQAVMVMVAELYTNREASVISDAAQRSLSWLLRGHKVRTL